jgi:hypothetical protein
MVERSSNRVRAVGGMAASCQSPRRSPMRTEKECKKIGVEMCHGKIFHSVMVPESEDPLMPFPALRLLPVEDLRDLIEKGLYSVFEYMSKAMPRVINDMPVFMSFQWMTEQETDWALEAYSEEAKRMEELSDQTVEDL